MKHLLRNCFKLFSEVLALFVVNYFLGDPGEFANRLSLPSIRFNTIGDDTGGFGMVEGA